MSILITNMNINLSITLQGSSGRCKCCLMCLVVYHRPKFHKTVKIMDSNIDITIILLTFYSEIAPIFCSPSIVCLVSLLVIQRPKHTTFQLLLFFSNIPITNQTYIDIDLEAQFQTIIDSCDWLTRSNGSGVVPPPPQIYFLGAGETQET